MTASTKAKPAPHSMEDRLLAARRVRKEVKALLGQAVLQGRSEREIAALQEELDIHTRDIERFTAAIEAQAQTQAEQYLEARKATVDGARSTIASRDTEIAILTADLLAGIEKLAPLASRLRDAVGERNAALRSGLKAGLDKEDWSRVNGEGIVTPLPFIASALGSALIESGLPSVGVHLDVSTRSDAEQLALNLQRVGERTERMLRKADAALITPADDEDDLDEEC